MTTVRGGGYSLFYPWGKPWQFCTPYFNDYPSFAGFAAKYCDCNEETPSPCGAYNHAQGRWMGPLMAQMFQPNYDLADPQSLNQYSYDGNDPTTPDGSRVAQQQPWAPPNAAGIADNAREAAIQLIKRDKDCLDLLKKLAQKLRQAIDPSAGQPIEQELEGQINEYTPRFDDTNPDECANTPTTGSVIHFNFWPFFDGDCGPRPLTWIHESFHGLPGGSANDQQAYEAAYEAEQNSNYVPQHPSGRDWNSLNYEKILEKYCGPKKRCGKR